MNRRQKSIILNFIFIITVTAGFIVAAVNFKDFVNKSEAMRIMESLAEKVQEYRRQYRILPLESYLTEQRRLLDDVRLGEINYRAQWIKFGAQPDTILVYIRKNYSLLIGSGYIVMRLDGHVQWMEIEEFENLLKQQQSEVEIDVLKSSKPF